MEEGNSYQMLNSMMEKVVDIDKDVDEILEKGNKMSDNNMLPAMMMSNSWMNNPFMYLVMLAWMNNGGWGGWGGNGAAAAAMSGQDTNLLLNAINNSSSISQRDADRAASAFNTAAASLGSGLCNINNSITQLMGQNGIQAQAVINAIQQSTAAEQLQICQQTNALQQGQFQLGVTIQNEAEKTRALIANQACEAQIRNQADTIDQLRDAAQTATLLAAINGGAAARSTSTSGS